MKISSMIISSLFAGAAGAIAGTLFAPNKGTKTRDNIAKKGHEYKEYLMDNYDDLADSVSNRFENLADETKSLSKKAKEKAKKAKS